MLHTGCGTVIRDKIVVLVVPGEKPRADLVDCAVLARNHLLFDIPVEVLKADLPVVGDRGIDDIDTVVDVLIKRFVAVCDDHLTLQFSGIVFADEMLKLADQFSRLLRCDKLGRLHQIDEKLDFRKFKVAGEKLVAVMRARTAHDIVSEINQCLNIVVDALALRFDSVGGKIVDQLRCCRIMRLIGVLL